MVEPGDLLPAAIRLAEDIASGDADFITSYKALLNDGYAMDLADALALEHARSLPYNSTKTPDDLEATRAAVIARGRKQ